MGGILTKYVSGGCEPYRLSLSFDCLLYFVQASQKSQQFGSKQAHVSWPTFYIGPIFLLF